MIWGPNNNELWAVGGTSGSLIVGSLIHKWDGTKWTEFVNNFGVVLRGIAGAPNGAGIVVGPRGFVARKRATKK